MMDERTEQLVVSELSQEGRILLKRVLEIEREKLHLSAAAPTIADEILVAVKGILP